jgi:hypothetical protein
VPLIASLGLSAHNGASGITFLFALAIRDMPIKVQCACGAAFAAKDELAGKTVKCPKCQKPLKIAAQAQPAQAAAKPSSAPKSAKPASAAKPAPARPAPAPGGVVVPVSDTGNAFDEIGLQAAAVGTRPCPGCTEPMPLEAVICIKCGYNARIGRRMETAKLSGSGGDGNEGHGAVATGLLDKAAKTLEEDALEDKKKTREGLPWWVYLIFLLALVVFLAVMIVRGHRYEEAEKKAKEKGHTQLYRANEFSIACGETIPNFPRSYVPCAG